MELVHHLCEKRVQFPYKNPHISIWALAKIREGVLNRIPGRSPPLLLLDQEAVPILIHIFGFNSRYLVWSDQTPDG